VTVTEARNQMTHELHAALYGTSWERPQAPQDVWEACLEQVRHLAALDPPGPLFARNGGRS
jgi:hypothetical protein